MNDISFSELNYRANECGLTVIAALFNGRHIKDQVANLVAKRANGDDFTAISFRCVESADPGWSRWQVTGENKTIDRDAVRTLPPETGTKAARYKWLCPGCGDITHGDSGKDSIFEIRHDPRCIGCRVRAGEYRFTGSKFEKVSA
jgi:hypothetical protein